MNWSYKKRLKPQDIRSKEFRKRLFGVGYDPEEVEAFLIEVANAYQELLEELEELRGIVPENNTNELMKKARDRIEEIFQKAMEEKEKLEAQNREMEIEIEKLKLVRDRMYDKLKLVILDMMYVVREFCSDGLKKDKGKEMKSQAG